MPTQKRTTLVVVALCACAFLLFFGARYIHKRFSDKQANQKAVLKQIGEALKNEEANYGFHIIDGKVVFEGRNHGGEFVRRRVVTPVIGANADTFQSFDQEFPKGVRREYYGVDDKRVFVKGIGPVRVLEADAATFRLLDKSGRFACDKSTVFYRSIKIEGADPSTFRRLKGDFSVDHDQAFLGHTTLPAEAATFEALSNGHISDVWHGGRYFEGPYYTEGWNRDANNIYFGNKRFAQADPATFEYLNFMRYAKDENNVYYETKVVEGADVSTFEILGTKYFNMVPATIENPSGHGPFARDSSRFYQYSEVYERDGPWSEGGREVKPIEVEQ